MPHVLHLLYDADVRWPLVENLVNGLVRHGFEQTIGYLCGDVASQLGFAAAGIDVVGFHRRRDELKRFRPALVGEIRHVLDERSIDIVHAHRHKPTVYGSLACWRSVRKVGLVSTVHGRNRSRSLTRKLTNRLLFKPASRIICVSAAVQADVLASNRIADPGKVVTIYNGIDAQIFSSATSRTAAREQLALPGDDTLLIGAVGRLKPVKAHDLLLRAFARVSASVANAHLVLAGEGPEEDSLRRLASELKLRNNVHFLGYQEDVPTVLRALDLFVMPSHSEGHPLALLEAMAAGIPVVATNVGGIPEILGDFQPRCLLTAGDMDGLAQKITKVLAQSAEQRAAIGHGLQKLVVDRFTVEQMAAAIAREYNDILTPKAGMRHSHAEIDDADRN